LAKNRFHSQRKKVPHTPDAKLEIRILAPWDGVSYEDALKLQQDCCAAKQNGWLLFCCPPTITLGKRGHFSDVLMPMDELRRLGVRLLPVDRGGEVTYHGPGQIIGFPFGTLENHTGDSRGVRKFVTHMKRTLESFISAELKGDPGGRIVDETTPDETAGIWLREAAGRRKIVSIGLGFHRDSISHGFALNVQPMQDGFELVNPCGEIGPRTASLFAAKKSEAEFQATLHRLAAILGA
jgi:lipoyl(octanoyl) transferase